MLCVVAVLCCMSPRPLAAVTMGTSFTYQGRFMDGGGPADASYDFEFKLYDASTDGTQRGSTVYVNDVDVSDGYFTVELDFGSSVFDGDARWLQIGVRPGESTDSYTTLTPRHAITSSPYALHTVGIAAVEGLRLSASHDRSKIQMYGDNGSEGIGTEHLHITLGAQEECAHSIGTKFYVTGSSNGNEVAAQIGFGGTGAPAGRLNSYFAGNVGIGTTSPDARLHISQNSSGTAGFDQYLRTGPFGWRVYDDGTYNNLVLDRLYGTWQAVPLAVFRADGNVGIGTTSPGSARLFVNGAAAGVAPNIQTNGDIVVGTGGAIFFDNFHSYAYGNYIMPSGGSNTQGFFTAGVEQMRITAAGAVGVGTSAPTEKLDVIGNIHCLQVFEDSDEQLKTDVQPLANVLDKLDQVRTVSFRWNETARAIGVKTGARQIGVLAQELEQVFPEMVSTSDPVSTAELIESCPDLMLTPEVRQRLDLDAERTRYKGVSYSQLTAVLLQAVKELRAQNEVLEQRIRVLEDERRLEK